MSEHLPDCDDYAFSGAGWHPNCERICICRQVRRIENRVRSEALRDAVKAVALVETYMDFPFESPGLAMSGETGVWLVREQALAAIEALGGESWQ